jgi:hypothetical protein
MKSRTIVVRPLMESHNLDDTALHPLDLAGRLVQEDLCLMRPAGSSHILAAASLCFPTRWRLNEKIGRALDAIHAPVPGLNERMGGAMARFFHHAKTDRPVWRLGWSLVDSPALFQPGGDGRTERDPTITSENAGARVWLRVERQTLRRLAVSGNVLFTIRIHRTPLGLVAADRVKAALLRDALATMPPEIARYKSLPVLGAAVIAYLERQISP